MARSSTVVRVSATMLRSLIAFCDTHHCGVILRIGGIEYGYTSLDLRYLLDEWDSSYTHCVRRGWDSRHFGFPVRTHYVHDAYDPHDALDDVLSYAHSIGGAELVETAHQLVNGVNPLTGVVVDRKTFLASVW